MPYQTDPIVQSPTGTNVDVVRRTAQLVPTLFSFSFSEKKGMQLLANRFTTSAGVERSSRWSRWPSLPPIIHNAPIPFPSFANEDGWLDYYTNYGLVPAIHIIVTFVVFHDLLRSILSLYVRLLRISLLERLYTSCVLLGLSIFFMHKFTI